MPIRIVMLTLFVSLSSKTLAQAPFTFEHDWGTVSIRVSAANDASLTSVYLDALQGGTTILDVTVPAEGTVTDAQVADLNKDGYPEVYVFINSAGSGSYGSVIGFAYNGNRSMTPIAMQPLPEDSALLIGYQGHDTFRVEEELLVRYFPIYRSGDSNANPQGGQRIIHYRLQPGEAEWLLEPLTCHAD